MHLANRVCFLHIPAFSDTTPIECKEEKKNHHRDPQSVLKVSVSAVLDLITQLFIGQPFWATDVKFNSGVGLFRAPLCWPSGVHAARSRTLRQHGNERKKKTKQTMQIEKFRKKHTDRVQNRKFEPAVHLCHLQAATRASLLDTI